MKDQIIEGHAREIGPKTELAIVPLDAVAIERAPSIVLNEAHTAAAALKDVLDKKPNPVMMGGERYLEYEDWATLGRFYGISARADEAEYVELGNARGFRAVAVALHRGEVISRATQYCLDDEAKWSERATYAWGYVTRDGDWSAEDPGRDQIVWEKGRDGKNRPKRERRITGVEPVPLFQLASMAQTRACSKVLRNVLAWVVVLAGYQPTPAEEMAAPGRVASAQEPEPVLVTDAADPLTIPEEPEAPPPIPEMSGDQLQKMGADPNAVVKDEDDPLWLSWMKLRGLAAEKGIRPPILTLPTGRVMLASASESLRRQLGPEVAGR